MTGKRKEASDLPPRMYAYEKKSGHKTYYFIDTLNKRHNLGRDLDNALKAYLELADHIPASMAERMARLLYIKSKRRAQSAGIVFTLTIDEISTILKRSNGKCEVTGIKFNDSKMEGKRIKPWSMSLDRIDSKKPYEFSNTRAVCSYVNLALNEFGIDMLKTILVGLASKELKARKQE